MSTTPLPPRFAVKAALAMRAKLQALADKIVPPQAKIIELAYGFQSTMLLRAAVSLGIADALAGGPQSATELSRRVGANPDALHRTLRALVSIGVFAIDDSGRFFNNRVSETLKKNTFASMHAWASYCGSKSNMAAWSDYERTVMSGHNAFERVHGTDCWSWFGAHPNEGKDFAQAMVDLTDFQAPTIAAAYPFSDFKTICDVAGGRGALLAAILQRFPNARGWLVDEAHVLEEASAFLDGRGVANRVDKKPGNMFLDVPRGADAYILKDIIHDWDDERSKQILKNTRSAMELGTRLLLVEIVVEHNETMTPGPLVDVHMMTVCCDGRQRSTQEYRELLAACGFRLQRVLPTAVPASIVEAMAV